MAGGFANFVRRFWSTAFAILAVAWTIYEAAKEASKSSGGGITVPIVVGIGLSAAFVAASVCHLWFLGRANSALAAAKQKFDQEIADVREALARIEANQATTTKSLLRSQAESIVYELHERWFVDALGKQDNDYRVSVFVMEYRDDGRVWACYARTGLEAGDGNGHPRREATEWPQLDGEPSSRAGLIAWAYHNNHQYASVLGLDAEQRKNAAEKEHYLHRTKLTAQQHEQRSWPFASLLVSFPRKRGRVPFALVVERKSGQQIAPLEPASDQPMNEDMFRRELQLVATLWCHPQGEE